MYIYIYNIHKSTKTNCLAIATLSFTHFDDRQATVRFRVTWRHLINSSKRLFRMFFFRPFKIRSFSSRHKRHLLEPAWVCLVIPHLTVNSLLLSELP